MPFTISHAAAAFPVHVLSKRRLPLAALMIGSMAPDFAYFLPFYAERLVTHSLEGIFTFCLPISLLVWLFFLLALERPTIAFLPDGWRTRIAPSDSLSVTSVLLAVVAIVLGAATHLVWDAFTHSSTPIVEAMPAFREELFEFRGRTIRVYTVLQLASSVFGLAVLGWWAWRIHRRKPVDTGVAVAALQPSVTHFERLLAALLIGAVACCVGLFNTWRYWARFGELSMRSSLFLFLIGAMSGAVLGWTMLALAIRGRSHLEKLPPLR